MSKHQKADKAKLKGVTGETGTLKARVERAALELFARKGVDGVSIKELAKAAGISEGAMYRHYSGKDELASALFDTIHARLYDLIKTALNTSDTFKDAVFKVVEVYCTVADDDPALFSYHLTHMYKFGPETREGRPDPVSLVVERIKKAIKDQDIPKEDAEVLAAAALGVVLQTAAHHLSGRLSGQMKSHAPALSNATYRVLAG